jgi:hypothetical protein
MSLDVRLYYGGKEELPCRHCGGTGRTTEEPEEVYEANVTHNLAQMAEAAGIYKHLWRPEEIGVTKASQLIEPLRVGLELLKADPDRFEAYNPSNGWGSYKNFVPWVESYLRACEANRDAEIRVSR